LRSDPVGAINRLHQAQIAGANASKSEIEFVLEICYLVNNKGITPVNKNSLIILLKAFRAIASFSARSYDYHLGCLSCGNNRNIVSCIDDYISKLPEVEFLHNGYSVALRIVANLQGMLDTVNTVDLNESLKPYWDQMLSMAKRYICVSQNVTFEHHINKGEGVGEEKVLEIDVGSITIACHRYKGDKNLYRIHGMAEGLSLNYSYLEIENLWRQMVYAASNKVHDFEGGVFVNFDSKLACRLHPCSNGVTAIELSDDKTLDVMASLCVLMMDIGNDQSIKRLIKNERIAHGYI
jgi:hypothetical protein